MKIGGFQKVSTVDYPGHLCSTIFLSGCNLRCRFCHNPSLVSRQEETQDITVEEILAFLKKRAGLLEGVCITGGEPTLNNGLEELVSAIKALGYKVKLDTNGTNPQVVRNLLEEGLLDYIAVDVKAPMERYEEIAGCWVNTEKIKETIEIVLNSNIDYEFRTTFLPDLDEKDIKKIAESIAGSKRYVVQQYRNNTTLDEEYSVKKPYDAQYVMNVFENIRPMFEACEVRGIQ